MREFSDQTVCDNLSDGGYTLHVRDATGCILSQVVPVTLIPVLCYSHSTSNQVPRV